MLGQTLLPLNFFFDNAVYHSFVEHCGNIGINVPILPGLLPVLSIGQVRRFCAMCEATLPIELENRLEESAEENQPEVGADWALGQIKDLLNRGAPGYHLYALNKSKSTLAILDGLGSKRS